jgi:hypothetical protein
MDVHRRLRCSLHHDCHRHRWGRCVNHLRSCRLHNWARYANRHHLRSWGPDASCRRSRHRWGSLGTRDSFHPDSWENHGSFRLRSFLTIAVAPLAASYRAGDARIPARSGLSTPHANRTNWARSGSSSRLHCFGSKAWSTAAGLRSTRCETGA